MAILSKKKFLKFKKNNNLFFKILIFLLKFIKNFFPYSFIKSLGKKIFHFFIFMFLINLLIIIFSYYFVIFFSKDKIYNDEKKLPFNKVGLVLGTSPFLKKGGENPFFFNRIKAAVYLYKIGKIKFIIVSGDNRTKYYNEPKMMKKKLLKYGVPAKAIIMDFAGFRTFDSVVRCKKVFGQNSFTIISQEFQNQRAIYIAEEYGIKASAYNAKDVKFIFSYKTYFREYLAKVKVLLDLHILKTQPKFLGKKIIIN